MSVQFKGTSGSGFISQNESDDGLLTVHGVALGSEDVTRGHLSKEKKLWRPEVLREAASSLQGKDIVVDHENKSAYHMVGRVTDSDYKEGVGIIYQGVVDSDELESKIKRQWLDVSPRIIHSSQSEQLEDDVKAPKKIHDISNLSIVRKGASESNQLNIGEHEELSVDELRGEFDEIDFEDSPSDYQRSLTKEELKEFNNSNSCEVNLSTEEAERITEELQDIEDFDFSQWLYDNSQGAEGASERFPCEGSHRHEIDGETWWMPCSNHDAFLKALDEADNPEELAEFTQDDWVQWDWSGGNAYGKVTDVVSDGSRTVEGNTRTVSDDDNEQIVVIDQVDEDGESQNQRVIKIVREDGENENNLRDWSPNSEEATQVEELSLSESRTPTFSGTEEKSWGDIPANTLTYWTDALEYEAEEVSDLTNSQKQEIAEHTLLGDSDANNIRDLRFFPVVNGNTGKLNRGALEAVRGGRGQSANLSQDTYNSAFEVAGRLLNEKFNADVTEEFSPSTFSNAVEVCELDEHEELDDVYSTWSDTVNMTATELRRWSGNGCSRIASVNPDTVIERNLNLLETPKSEWGTDEIEDANRTISFISRMRAQRPDGPSDGRFGCPSDWAISLLNWAYNPFDSIPNEPDNDDLDSVEELSEHKEEMKKIASQMSSHTEMTKAESLSLLESMASGKEKRDFDAMAKAVSMGIGVDKEEMKKHMEEMAEGVENSSDGNERYSLLNKVIS